MFRLDVWAPVDNSHPAHPDDGVTWGRSSCHASTASGPVGDGPQAGDAGSLPQDVDPLATGGFGQRGVERRQWQPKL